MPKIALISQNTVTVLSLQCFSVYILFFPVLFCLLVTMAPPKKRKSKKVGGSRVRELHRAIETGDESQIFSLCLSRPGTDPLLIGGSIVSYHKMREDPRGAHVTPLLVAVHFAEYDMVRYLIEEEPDLDEGLLHGMGPLALSLDYKHYEISRLLVSSGADVNLPDEEGKTPMFHAIQEDSPVSIVKELLAAGVNKDAIIFAKMKSRPITRAISVKNIPVVKFLLGMNVDANSPTHEFTTPLNIAISYNSVEITKMLIEYGVNLEGLHGTDAPPLYLAVGIEDTRILQMLIQSGVNIHRVFSPSKYMVGRAFFPDTTAFQLSVMVTNLEAAKELLQAGIDINYPCPRLKRNALHLSCFLVITEMNAQVKERQEQIIQLLLENGTDMNARDSSGMNAIMCSLTSENWIALEELIRTGRIDVNKPVKRGDHSIFTYVIKSNNSNLIKLCIDFGADCSLQPEGIRPFELVARSVSANHIESSVLKHFFKHHPIDGLQQNQQFDLMLTTFAMRKQFDFINAVRLNSKEALSQALESGADRSVFHTSMKSPVHFAASKGFDVALRCLLEQVPANSLLEGTTPLHMAAKHGHLKCCILLLRAGACFNYKDRDGVTALQLAETSDEDCTEIIQLLKAIKKLFSLAKRGSYKLIEFLKEKSTSDSAKVSSFVNCVNEKGNTLLAVSLIARFERVSLELMNLILNYKNE